MSEMGIYHQLRQLLAAWITSDWPTNLPESEGRFSKESNAGTLAGFSQLTRSEWDDQLAFSGTLRCNSSMKFSRKITWPASCWFEPPA